MFTNPGNGSREEFYLPLIDGATVRNGTSMGTSHLDPRSANSEKIPRYQTGVVRRSILIKDLVERASMQQQNTQQGTHVLCTVSVYSVPLNIP